MGFLDGILGRRKAAPPDLDQLFALPNAAITLEVTLGFRATGIGSVAFRAPEGRAFARVQADVQALLDADGGPRVEAVQDDFGFTWLVCRTEPPDLPTLVTDVHAVNSSLQDSGFGPTLLCSLVGFRDEAGRALGMVYLFKQGTFYPFAPEPGARNQQRDNMLELQVRDALGTDLRMEPDLGRWFAVWGAPGM